jgi:hypothetical protein
MTFKKKYNQIIELEYIDILTATNTQISVAVLLSFVDHLNNDTTFKNKSMFEVIKYGFQGYYAVIGVINYNNENIEDSIVENKFIDFIKNNSLKMFIDFSIEKSIVNFKSFARTN